MHRANLLASVLLPVASLLSGAAVSPNARADDADAPQPGWIWLGDTATDDQTVRFRREFRVPRGRISGAKLYASCDNVMTVWINGTQVLRHDTWESPAFRDVSEVITRGRNVISVEGRNAGGAAGLLAKLVVETDREDDDFVIVTDENWKVTDTDSDGFQDPDFDDSEWEPATRLADIGGGPWARLTPETLAAAVELREPQATPIELLTVKDGFQVELLYSVPKEEQGSWVNMCTLPDGRLIVSDQYGGLYRITPPAVERIPLTFKGIGAALRTEGTRVLVAQLVPGGAADRDGRLREGDAIIAVTVGGDEPRTTADMNLSEVVDLIRNADHVTLLVEHDGSSEPEEIDLTPRTISVRDALDNSDTLVEPLDLDIGEAQGLLWAFDSLYIVVNRGGRYDSGLYRARDTDDDGELDDVELLRRLDGGGEHGPHAVLLSPDGESLYVVCGDSTRLTEFASSRVPQVWDEDILLPRPYGRGFMKGTPAPGGYIARTDPDGQNWELVSTGFRNQFDAAFNRDGELFTYDADMEWDVNTPWYRPTRINHVTSGSEWGWRNGGGKWPTYYSDSLPPVVNIGPGSPTGVCFGYGANFPEKYRDALFICDWSYGKLYAVHLTPDGATYSATFEEFVSGTPLPLTDVVISPVDQAMYFTIGGRRVQSGLYRVTYVGGESPVAEEQPVDLINTESAAAARAARHELEALHVATDGAVEAIWPQLGSEDRFIRFAARIALEHQPVASWQDRALAEPDPARALPALMALVRQQVRHPSLHNDVHDPIVPTYDAGEAPGTTEPELKSQILTALGGMGWSDLDYQQKLDLLRVYTLTFARMGPPDASTRRGLMHRFDTAFPARGRELNSELCQMLVYLQSPTIAAKTMPLLHSAPTQEEQLDYARTLRHLRTGWNLDLRRDYFAWFVRAATYRGGASFGQFVQNIKADAVAHLSEEQVTALRDILEAVPESTEPALSAEPRQFVREWTMDDLAPLVQDGLHDRNYRRGREMFAAAKCFACHRFDGEGGAVGPDLTALSGRFSPRDILESILEPSKTISDQYAAVQILTLDGRVIVGRIVNLSGDSFRVNTNMLDPNELVGVDRKQIDEMIPSKVSMMPKGLLDTLNQEEVLDLMAYLLSRGDPDSPMFAQDGAVEPPDGFRALFNGVDLNGWHGMPHFDPRELASMSEEERQARIEEWTEDALQHWSVENGVLVNDGHGAYLTTDEEFEDYEFLIDYRTVPLADSGIYLRSNPQVQIWDYTEEGGKWNLGADKGSGGLWNNSPGASGKDPYVLADRPFGEWNSFRIRQTGARTSVWLNGYQVVDHAIMENFWDRGRPLFRSGPIQLQTHGGEIRWRNIFLRDIGPEEANDLLREHSGDGFVSIFNGSDLTGWQGAVDNYEVVDGAIRCKAGHGGNLFTEEEYGDFQVRLEFKLPPGGNNGLAIRYPGQGNPAYDGMCELQVIDTEHEKYGGLDPRQAHGSPYGMVPAARGFLRPTGEWNFQLVTVQGSRVRVELNGSVIVDTDLAEVTEYMDNSPHPGKDLESGYFGFAGHNDPVEFRRIEIRRL